MQKHTLSANQANRLGLPNLAGKKVDIVLRLPHEKPSDLKDHPIAKEVYYGKKRIGGVLDLLD